MSEFKLTVGIISYNRPRELYRSILSVFPIPAGVEVVVCDDKSPKFDEILVSIGKVVDKNPQIRIITNQINLGYDRNLFKVIEEASSDYVLLLGDDDYFEEGAIVGVLNFLSRANNFHCGFVRFKDNKLNNYFRHYSKDIAFENNIMELDGSFLYNSILFSGLLFRKSTVLHYQSIFSKYFHSIYIQVALFGFLNSKYGAFYLSGPGVIIGGDGENGFGLNEASFGIDSDLKDRSTIISNLSYHKRLFHVIQKLQIDVKQEIFNVFLKEYKIRSIKAIYEARRKNKNLAVQYLNELRNLNIRGLWLFEPVYFLLINLPLLFLIMPIRIAQVIFLKYRNFKNSI